MKPNESIEYTKYLLHNVNNYNPVILNTKHEILKKLTEVLIEFMRLISEKINIKNKQYYIYIFERGIDAIIHIFSIIFFYTKNLELTFYHCQKAYYFYVEFIEQISDDSITFLQLSSRDALLFVYKKTIFELNNDYKKNVPSLTDEESVIISYTDEYVCIYKKMVSYILRHNEFTFDNKLNYINMCSDKMQHFFITIFQHHIHHKYIECIYLFTNMLANKETMSVDHFFKMLDSFIKELQTRKKTLAVHELKKNIMNTDININIDNKGFLQKIFIK